MQNKLYTTLANIFNEIKQAKGSNSTLADAIDEKVKGQQEIVNARDGYTDLNTRLDDIKSKTSSNASDVGVMKQQVEEIQETLTTMQPVIEKPVYQINGNEFLLDLKNKVTTKQDEFSLYAGQQKQIKYDEDNVVLDVYRKDTESNFVNSSVDFTATNLLMDNQVNMLDGDTVKAVTKEGLYKIPLYSAIPYVAEGYDSCVIPYLGTCEGDYDSKRQNDDGSWNWSNHLFNCLEARGAIWSVKRSFLNVILSFAKPIPITKIETLYASNSTVSKIAFWYSQDLISWTKFYDSTEKDIAYTLPASMTVKYVKLEYNIFDNLRNNYQIDVSKISVYSYEYYKSSGTVTTKNFIPIADRSEDIKIVPKSPLAADVFSNTKFAIANHLVIDGKWVTYIPKTRVVKPMDFYDMAGYKYTGDLLNNTIKQNSGSKIMFEAKSVYSPPITTINGTIGTCTIADELTRTETNAWKPTAHAMLKVIIKINGVEYIIPLSSTNLNQSLIASVGGYSISFKISPIRADAIKVFIFGADDSVVTIDEVRVEADVAYNLIYDNHADTGFQYRNWGQIYGSYSCVDSGRYIGGFPVEMYENYVNYDVHKRSDIWFSGHDYGSHGPTGVTYNSVCIMPKELNYSNRMLFSQSNDTAFLNQTFRKTNIHLPVSVYLSGTTAQVLADLINLDTLNIISDNTNMIFDYRKEFVTKAFIGDRHVIGLEADQNAVDIENIQYSISFDGYNYYIFNQNSLKWDATFSRGMTANELLAINDSHYKLIHVGQWLYIKTVILSPEASVSDVKVKVDEDEFVEITDQEILSKGMNADVLQSIEPESMWQYISDNSSVVQIASSVESTHPIYQFSLQGFDIVNYNNIMWQEIDPTTIVKYLLPNSNFIIKNVSAATQYIRTIARIIDNQTAIIDGTDDLKTQITDVETKVNNDIQNSEGQFNLIYQSIDMIEQAMQDGTPPPPLPTAIIARSKEIDIPILSQGESYTVTDVNVLRGIQVWEENIFAGISDTLYFNLEHSDQFTYYGIEPKTSGCEIIRTWDTTNPYYCNENPTSSVGSWGPNSYPWFDLTCSRAGNGGSIAAMFDNAALPGNFWGFNTVTSGLGAHWNLPGEAARYVDIIFDFRQLRFVNYISNLRFADANIASTDQNAPPELNQITTFSWSVDGLEYTQVAQYTGYKTGLTVNFNKECRYVKIRLENPYSINRGAGYVGLSMLDIYVSEIHYDYDKEYYVYNTDPINTTTWLNINKITVDRYIDHGFADMKFALCDTEEPTLWKYWNAGTSTWLTTSSLTMANAMTIETLLALTEDQLNLLDRGNLRIAAIFKTTDRFKTPVLRNVGFVHDDSSEKCYILSDSNNVQVSFGVDNKMLIVKNATPGDKKLKLVVT